MFALSPGPKQLYFILLCHVIACDAESAVEHQSANQRIPLYYFKKFIYYTATVDTRSTCCYACGPCRTSAGLHCHTADNVRCLVAPTFQPDSIRHARPIKGFTPRFHVMSLSSALSRTHDTWNIGPLWMRRTARRPLDHVMIGRSTLEIDIQRSVGLTRDEGGYVNGSVCLCFCM